MKLINKKTIPMSLLGLVFAMLAVIIIEAGVTPPEPLELVPPDALTDLRATQTESTVAHAATTPLTATDPSTETPPEFVFIKVSQGDTLGGLVKKYTHTTVKELFALNSDILADPDKIKVGQLIRISRSHANKKLRKKGGG